MIAAPRVLAAAGLVVATSSTAGTVTGGSDAARDITLRGTLVPTPWKGRLL